MEINGPARKQLELNSLIEFSQLISSKLDLNYILNNILLSVMGKMLISKAVVLLKTSDADFRYIIKAVKGIDLKLLNTSIEAEFPKLSVFNFNDITDKSDFLNEHRFEYYFKIYFQNKYLGILCLGKKLNNTELFNNEIIFIETMLNISSSAVENTIKFEQVTELNSALNNKIRQLNSLFELGKEFNSSFIDKKKIIKLLNYTLLGNFGIKDYAILSRDSNNRFKIIKDSKNFELDKFNPDILFSGDNINQDFKRSLIIDKSSQEPFFEYLFSKGFELYIPTIINNEIDSIICLGKKLSKNPYTAEDIEFLESIMNMSLISLHNYFLFQEYLSKQKIESELIVAREIQIALLPNKIPETKDYKISGLNMPALQIGGDYFDVIKLTEDKLVLVIADVSGKGTPASLLMASIQSAVHSYLKLYKEGEFNLAKVTEKINELIYENTSSEKFITFFWGILDNKENTFEYINAGHNPPLLLKNNEFRELTEGGFIIGILDVEMNYEIGKVHLEKDDLIVLYTDGVTEALDINNEEYGETKLKEVIFSEKSKSPKEIINSIKDSLLEFSENMPQYDDITIIVLKKIS
ncbi:MAG TPA: PP2C family protein-serine/threonine phosphatase [Ignavibacteria bacterium]|nr:PP2C family protein-serine/threonine phosphatase [Ignavibacteria bacterium]